MMKKYKIVNRKVIGVKNRVENKLNDEKEKSWSEKKFGLIESW